MNIFEQNNDIEFHFMVDIETLATSNNAAITELGAVSLGLGIIAFDIQCVDEQGERSAETIQWRGENSLPWIREGISVNSALIEFFAWIKTTARGREPILWCKGTDFDAVILKNAATRCGLDVPWKYNSIRDVRTLLQFFPQFKVPKEQVTHSAIADARLQKEYLLKIANEIAAGVGNG